MKKSQTTSGEENLDLGNLLDVRTVSQVTGLTPTNLRMWEKRYGVATPDRSETGRRRYREEEVKRLQLLKRLVDQGHSIGAIASLPDERLETLATETNESVKPGKGERDLQQNSDHCRLILVGDALFDLFEIAEMQIDGATVVAKYPSLVEAEEAGAGATGDLLLVDLPAIFPETIATIERLNERLGTLRATLFYSFAPGHVVENATSNRLSLVRMPRRIEEVRAQCEREVSFAATHRLTSAATNRETSPSSSGIPSRRFSDKELSFISRISPVLECECPNHLAELLTSLLGFEQYSAECENRNREDARMHAYLHRRTAKARSIIEEALQQLMEFEGISVSSSREDQ